MIYLTPDYDIGIRLSVSGGDKFCNTEALIRAGLNEVDAVPAPEVLSVIGKEMGWD